MAKNLVRGVFLVENRVLRDSPFERLRLKLDMLATLRVINRGVVDHFFVA